MGFVEKVDVLDVLTVIGCDTDSLLILIAIMSSLPLTDLLSTGELGTELLLVATWSVSSLPPFDFDDSLGEDGVDGNCTTISGVIEDTTGLGSSFPESSDSVVPFGWELHLITGNGSTNRLSLVTCTEGSTTSN